MLNLNYNIEEIIEEYERLGQEVMELEVGHYDHYEDYIYFFLLQGFILEKNGKVYELRREDKKC